MIVLRFVDPSHRVVDLHHRVIIPFMEAALRTAPVSFFLARPEALAEDRWSLDSAQVGDVLAMQRLASMAMKEPSPRTAVLAAFAKGETLSWLLRKLREANEENDDEEISISGIDAFPESFRDLLDDQRWSCDEIVGSLISFAALLRIEAAKTHSLEKLDEAFGIAKREADAAQMARAHALRGEILRSRAGEDGVAFGRVVHELCFALILTDPEVHESFFDRMIRQLCEVLAIARPIEQDLVLTLKHMARHFDDSRPGRPAYDAPIEDTWRRWLRAQIIVRFGSHRRAEQMMTLCQREFIERRLLPEYLVVSLDLGEILLFLGRLDELRRLSSEMVYQYRFTESLEIRGCLLAWRDNILHGDLDHETHREARRIVGRWMREDLERRAADSGYSGPSIIMPP